MGTFHMEGLMLVGSGGILSAPTNHALPCACTPHFGFRAELDEDTPGFGKHYCIACARYFQNAEALATHDATKPHKRQVKMLMTTARPHNQRDAEAAAGMGAPDNGPKLRSASIPVAMQT